MAQLYDHSLMLSIAIQNARFSLIVSFSHSEPPTKALKRLIQTNLTLQVAHLAQDNLNLITITPVWTGVHKGVDSRGPAPGPEIITMCSQCHKVKSGLADWVDPADLAELPDRDKISHGICPTCVRANYPKPLADEVLRKLADQH